MHFRYAFSEIAANKSPTEEDWLVHNRNSRYSKFIGPLPRSFTQSQKEIILKICSEANISSIASSCRFPDWLGYLGLVLEDMYSESGAYRALSSRWALQLSGMVSSDTPIHFRLKEIAEEGGTLNIKDLQNIESNNMHNSRF